MLFRACSNVAILKSCLVFLQGWISWDTLGEYFAQTHQTAKFCNCKWPTKAQLASIKEVVATAILTNLESQKWILTTRLIKIKFASIRYFWSLTIFQSLPMWMLTARWTSLAECLSTAGLFLTTSGWGSWSSPSSESGPATSAASWGQSIF